MVIIISDNGLYVSLATTIKSNNIFLQTQGDNCKKRKISDNGLYMSLATTIKSNNIFLQTQGDNCKKRNFSLTL